MFRFPKTLDPITLFHNPKLAPSTRALQILKAASEASTASAAEANNNNANATQSTQRGEFDLQVTDVPPTTQQLQNILDYIASGPTPRPVSEIVKGANDAKEALRVFAGLSEAERGERFFRPVTVDWINGKAVVGDNESEILKMVKQIPHEAS